MHLETSIYGTESTTTIYVEIFARRNFCQFRHLLLLAKFVSHRFFNDYIEDMATFTALAKIYSTKYFYNTKVAGLGGIFVQRKFCHIWYMSFDSNITAVHAIKSLPLGSFWTYQPQCILHQLHP